MNLTLPHISQPVTAEDGRTMVREWYKPLSSLAATLTSSIADTIYADTGAVNVMVITAGTIALTKALVRYLVPGHTNTSTTVTLNDSKLGAAAVIFPNGSLPAIGQILAAVTLEVVFNGTAWEIQNIQPANQSIPGNLTVAGHFTPLGEFEAPTAGTAGQVLLSAGAGLPPVWGASTGFSGTIVTAKLTTATGSMVFVNGLLVSQVAAT